MAFWDDICDMLEKADPTFDRNDKEKVNVAIKCFILSVQDKENGKELREKYFRMVAEEEERQKLKKLVSCIGIDSIKTEIAVLNFEKEILEHKIMVAKNFLN